MFHLHRSKMGYSLGVNGILDKLFSLVTDTKLSRSQLGIMMRVDIDLRAYHENFWSDRESNSRPLSCKSGPTTCAISPVIF